MMRRWPCLAALMLAVVVPGTMAETPAGRNGIGPEPARAVWVWEADTFAMLTDAAFRGEAMEFLAEKRLAVLYLYADEYLGKNILAEEPARYRDLIGTLHEAGFEVHALLGSAFLETHEYVLPGKRGEAAEMLRRVLDYNRTVEPEQAFDGINVDVEPYLLDDWRTLRAERSIQYLEMSAMYMRMKEDAGLELPIGAAMPFWFDSGPRIEWRVQTRLMNQHVQDIYDYVAIMDYRDTASGNDGLIRHASKELAYADEIKKDVVIGIETGDRTPLKVTFFDEDEPRMERKLETAAEALSGHRSFAGFAVHHFGSYRAWLERQKRPVSRQAICSPHQHKVR